MLCKDHLPNVFRIQVTSLYFTGNGMSDNSGLSSVTIAVTTFAMIFIVSVTVAAIIAAYVCVKRTLHKVNNHNPKQQSPGPQEEVLYEQVCLPSQTVTKNDLELQPNPAYGTSHKLIVDNNPVYESCK